MMSQEEKNLTEVVCRNWCDFYLDVVGTVEICNTHFIYYILLIVICNFNNQS